MSPDRPSSGVSPYAGIVGIATAIVSTMSWGDTLNAIAQKIGEAMFGWSASINSFDAARRAVTYEGYWCQAGITQEDLDYIGHVSLLEDRPDFRTLIERRQIVEAHVDDPAVPEVERDLMKRWGIRSSLDGPLIYDGEVIGTVGVEETRFVRKFTTGERDLFEQLCALVSIGVHTAQASRSLKLVEQRLAALVAFGADLGAARTRDDVCAAMSAVLTTALAASSVSLDPPSADISTANLQRADESGLSDVDRAAMASSAAAVRLLVPVGAGATNSGVMNVGWADEQHCVVDDDLSFAGIVAAQLALALVAVAATPGPAAAV